MTASVWLIATRADPRSMFFRRDLWKPGSCTIGPNHCSTSEPDKRVEVHRVRCSDAVLPRTAVRGMRPGR